MFKRWIPASFIAVAMALALAGGAVLAAGGGQDLRKSGVIDRAAGILGVDPTALHDAHDQARREADAERIAALVESLIAKEMITQVEADSFNTWMAGRPDIADYVLFSKLTSSVLGRSGNHAFKLRIDGLGPFGDMSITERMAEILGLDTEELADALESGEADIEASGRLAMAHAVIDELLANDSVSVDEATDLHTWANDAPQWLFDFDQSRIRTPSFGGGLFSDRFGKSDWLKRLPNRGGSFTEREHEFRFEFEGPEGSFRFGPFGPNDHKFPFEDEQFQDLFERFDFEQFENLEGLAELDGLEGLFERFRDREHFGPPFGESIEPTEVPDPTATSA